MSSPVPFVLFLSQESADTRAVAAASRESPVVQTLARLGISARDLVVCPANLTAIMERGVQQS